MKALQSHSRSATAESREVAQRAAHIVNDIVDSRELIGRSGKVVIEHQSMQYELRITRQGKLILTK
jgi:hemin uptake protein HemP